ncbi:MAG: transmembrane anchor protein [Gemmatimonas sp.]|nr:transmembrane anchor protein [Gemmatimonas sp.]
MSLSNLPPLEDLPSAKTLRNATATAIGVAAVLLTLIVLPAEYGVDPTGAGRVLGLTEMGEIKQQLAREAAAAEAAEASGGAAPAATAAPEAMPGAVEKADTVLVSLEPSAGKEVKLVMRSGATARFAWTATGGNVNFDMHGDSTGAPNSYIPYRRGTGVPADSGVITAAMDGSHGWFWRNRSGRDVVVRLVVTGDYSELKKMY